jgi:hypothetical protein
MGVPGDVQISGLDDMEEANQRSGRVHARKSAVSTSSRAQKSCLDGPGRAGHRKLLRRPTA